MKSFYQAKTVAGFIQAFSEYCDQIPDSLYDVVGTHILIRGGEQVMPLSFKVEQLEEEFSRYISGQPDSISMVDSVIISQAVAKLKDNITKRIKVFVNNSKDKFIDSKPAALSIEEYFKHLEYVLLDYYEAFYRADEDRECLLAIFKRLRYKPTLYDIAKKLTPCHEVEMLEDDYMFNFLKYAKEFYKHYHMFYIKCGNHDIETASKLMYYSNDYSIVYEDSKPYAISFDIDFYKPVEHILEELDDFRNASYVMLSDTLGRSSEENNGAKIHMISDYVRDGSGKIVDRSDVSLMFNRWQRYLDIYDMREVKKFSWTKIRDAVNSKISGGFKKEVATIKNEYNEAVRLIESAVRGTFPY